MSENEKTSVAALISVILRRNLGRTIDVKWLVKNEAYAREIISLSREQGLDDLTSYANNLENLMFGAFKPTISTTTAKPSTEAKRIPPEPKAVLAIDDDIENNSLDVSKYIGHLR